MLIGRQESPKISELENSSMQGGLGLPNMQSPCISSWRLLMGVRGADLVTVGSVIDRSDISRYGPSR